MAIRFESNGVVQFENANGLRSYPFVDGVSLVSRGGDVLPDGIVTDVHVVVPAGSTPIEQGDDDTVAKVTSVHVSNAMVSACVTVYRGGSVIAALSAMVAAESMTPYMPYRMSRIAGSEDCGGVITFGDFDVPPHPVTYVLDDAKICDGCVALFDPPQLRSITDRRNGRSVRGDVKIDFSRHIVAGKTREGYIKLSLEEGSADELMSSCAKQMHENPCGATPITSINGVLPDSQGRIVLWFH
jgi:hypothetical protein